MEVMEAITKRRSIRAYQPKPVDHKVLDKILEAGRLAPSWANTQTWRFIVVRNEQVKTELADAANPAGSRNNVVMKQAPVLIAACAELNRPVSGKEKPSPIRKGPGSCSMLPSPFRTWYWKLKS